MEYLKRTHKDVKGTFLYKIGKAQLFGDSDWVGISLQGIYLADKNGSLGFFEWNWIKKINFSTELEVIYIFFYDLDSILNNVICQSKFWFKMFYLKSKYGEKSMIWGLQDTEQPSVIFDIVQYIEANDFCKITRV